MAKITYEDIKNINELYADLKTYAAVSRATGFSPATVKKYVQKNYVPVRDLKDRVENAKPAPEIDLNCITAQILNLFRSDDWKDLCILSEEEYEDIKSLWKEMNI